MEDGICTATLVDHRCSPGQTVSQCLVNILSIQRGCSPTDNDKLLEAILGMPNHHPGDNSHTTLSLQVRLIALVLVLGIPQIIELNSLCLRVVW